MTPELDPVSTVADAIIRELHEDYVELWVLPRRLRRALPNASDDEVQRRARTLLDTLTSQGVVLGSDVDGSFVPWDVEDPVGKVMDEWSALGRDPNIGEIAWLDLPS